MMDLYILRHGIAVERGTPGFENDEKRPLTPQGERKVRALAQTLERLGIAFDLILSSPLIRARRTAEIVAEVLDAPDRLRFTASLAPQGGPGALMRTIRSSASTARAVLVVGHDPYLSSLISTLLAGDTHIPLTLKKGGLCKLAVSRPVYGRCATLEWLVPPKLFR